MVLTDLYILQYFVSLLEPVATMLFREDQILLPPRRAYVDVAAKHVFTYQFEPFF
jgi:hypothetical protein